jgi:hypothetical protein
VTKGTVLRLALIAAAGLGALLLLAFSRGRNSRYFRMVGTVMRPFSAPSTVAQGLTRPFRPALGAPLDNSWHWMQPELVTVQQAEGVLTMTPVRESVWWRNERGPFLYRHLDGDGVVTGAVRVRKRTDPTAAPDAEWQFGGIMMRDPRGDGRFSLENYVFNVVGHRGKKLTVETKSTVNGVSDVSEFVWPTGDAELKIERRGATFTLAARANASAPWRTVITYERPDLPRVLQVGLISYAYSEGRGRHDMQVFFDAFAVE